MYHRVHCITRGCSDPRVWMQMSTEVPGVEQTAETLLHRFVLLLFFPVSIPSRNSLCHVCGLYCSSRHYFINWSKFKFTLAHFSFLSINHALLTHFLNLLGSRQQETVAVRQVRWLLWNKALQTHTARLHALTLCRFALLHKPAISNVHNIGKVGSDYIFATLLATISRVPHIVIATFTSNMNEESIANWKMNRIAMLVLSKLNIKSRTFRRG